MDNSDLKRNNAQYLWHPMAHPKAMKAEGGQADIIARGDGCHVWDIDGHKLLDGVAGLWSCNPGHSCKPVRDAVVAQLDELPFFNTFRGTTHPRAIELSRALVELMRPDGVAAVMFSNGGSDAVEGALKLARQCHKLRGDKDRSKFIAMKHGLPRRALWRHERQRQHGLSPCLRAAAAGLLPHRQPLAVPQRLCQRRRPAGRDRAWPHRGRPVGA